MSGDASPVEMVESAPKSQSKVETEIKEPARRLPFIDELPERARVIIRRAFQEAKPVGDRLSRSIRVGDKFVDKKMLVEGEIPVIQEETEQVPAEERKRRQDEEIQKVVQEINLIVGAAKKVNQWQDSPELRTTPVPFKTNYQEVTFTDEELRKFGSTKNPIRRAGQLVRGFRGDPQQKVFQDKMKHLLNRRIIAIANRLGVGPGLDNFKIEIYPAELNNIELLAKTSESTEPEVLDAPFDTYLQQAHEIASQVADHNYFLTTIDQWLQANSAVLRGVVMPFGSNQSISDLFSDGVSGTRRRLEEEKTRFLREMFGSANSVVNNFMHRFYEQLRDDGWKLHTLSQPIHAEGESGDTLNGSLTQDFVDLALGLKTGMDTLRARLATIPEFEGYGNTHQSPIDNVLGSAEGQMWLNERIATEGDLLFHVAPYDIVKRILLRGSLASRTYQIDHFGSSEFNSGNMRVGADFVERLTHQGSWEKISMEEHKRRKKWSSLEKEPDQEAHQVCFSENGPYIAYDDGISFVFGKAPVLTDKQFMRGDGLHLFDPDFSRDKKQAPGFAIDLTGQPIFLTVGEARREDFELFVKNELINSDAWKDRVTNAEEWIEDHVIYVPSTENGGQAINFDNSPAIKAAFWNRYGKSVPKGRIMPTGEQGETAVRILSPLWTYKVAA